MVRTVVESGFDVDDWVAGDDATVEGVFDTLLDRFAVFLWDDAAFDLVDELEAFARFVRLEFDPDVAVLTTATGLFDVFTLGFGGAADGFAVGNLWGAGVGFDAVFAFQAVDDDFEVKLTHAGDDSLAGFFVSVDAESRVFLGELGETDAHFFLVGLGLWLDGDRNRRIWELDGLEADGVGGIADGGASGAVFETDDGGNVASTDASDFFAFVGEHTDDTADAFFVAG